MSFSQPLTPTQKKHHPSLLALYIIYDRYIWNTGRCQWEQETWSKCREGDIFDYNVRTERTVPLWGSEPPIYNNLTDPHHQNSSSSLPTPPLPHQPLQSGREQQLNLARALTAPTNRTSRCLSASICAADSCLYNSGWEAMVFFGSLRLWLSLLAAHTQISRVAVTETGISKSSSIFPWLPSVTETLHAHTQPVNRAAIITSVPLTCCVTQKNQQDRHSIFISYATWHRLKQAFNWFKYFNQVIATQKHYETRLQD